MTFSRRPTNDVENLQHFAFQLLVMTYIDVLLLASRNQTSRNMTLPDSVNKVDAVSFYISNRSFPLIQFFWYGIENYQSMTINFHEQYQSILWNISG
jgi:hypothetical protein